LLPGVKHLLNDGDEIIVGKTFLRFHIIGWGGDALLSWMRLSSRR
jgi:hypothetical protein